MKFAPLILAGMAAAAPFGAFAQSTSLPPQQSNTTTTKPGDDKVTCRAQEETGSRIAKKKICMTAAQWRDQQFNAGQWAEHQQTYGSGIR